MDFRSLVTCYAKQGAYKKAIETYKEALKYPKSKNKFFVKMLNAPLALSYFHEGDYQKSLKYFEKLDAKFFTKELGDVLHSKIFSSYDKQRNKLIEKLTSASNKKMLDAIRKSNVKSLKEALLAGADINYKDKKGKTPLHVASYYDNVEIIKLLLEAGADIDAQSNDGSTVLMDASYRGYVDIVKFLLGKNVKVNLETKKRTYTALQYAIESIAKNRTNKKVARLLLNNNAKLSKENQKDYNQEKYLKRCDKNKDRTNNKLDEMACVVKIDLKEIAEGRKDIAELRKEGVKLIKLLALISPKELKKQFIRMQDKITKEKDAYKKELLKKQLNLLKKASLEVKTSRVK